MRFARRLVGLSILVALGGACDTTQPLQVESQSLALSFQAVNARVKSFDVWDVFLDNDADELPDDGMTHLWCVNTNQNVNPTSVPWNYSLDIKVLRAGRTIAQTLTSSRALTVNCPATLPGQAPRCNVTAYETGPGSTQISVPPKADICTVNGDATPCPAGNSPPAGGNRYRFRNVRRQSGATQTLMFSTPSPLFQDIRNDNPMSPLGLGQGLCSVGNPGPVNIDGKPQPFSIAINKGDTVLVKARLAQIAPQGPGMTDLLQGGGFFGPSSLSAKMTLDGREINLVGTSSGTALSFSYTSR